MNNDEEALPSVACSSVQVEVRIEESWINKFLSERGIVIPINEKIHLSGLKIDMKDNILTVEADISEKEGSSIEIVSRPVWDVANQSVHIEDFKLETKSKNLLVKSAGWFTQLFSKVDTKIEEQMNHLLAAQLEKIKKDPVHFPIPKSGQALVDVTNITVQEMVILDHAIGVTATIEGIWKLHLTV